jgi:predicted DCC family thiol-disulfide oxidoreductase YuxK
MSQFRSQFKLESFLGFDLRSLALFRIGLAIIVILDLIARASALSAHYSDAGVLPRQVLQNGLLHPWYWSFHLLNGQAWAQGVLFAIAIFFALLLLVGYRTRWATIAVWALTVSLHNRNPFLLFAGDDVLRAVLFWAMFLPLGASYSLESALNSSPNPLPKRVVSGATFAFMVQLCFIYIWSAAFKTKSAIWFPDGNAVYYALHFDQYATPFGLWMATWPLGLQKVLTFGALLLEWAGPLLIFIPIYSSFFRCIAIVLFILLHIGFGISFEIGMFSYLSIVNWTALIPSEVWDAIAKRWSTPPRQGLAINYDADCGFCKKVVHILRTLLVLTGTPLRKAQDDPAIHEAMLANNSWVVVDWQGHYHFKFEAIAYIVSLSPIFGFLAPLLRWQPVMAIGTRFYEFIASNRKLAGKFTRPFKYRPIVVQPKPWFNIVTLGILLLTTLWNLKGYVDQTVFRRTEPKNDWIAKTHEFFNKKTLQSLNNLGYITRLDQSWSIFAPNPPRDDGWFVIPGKLRDGSVINLLAPDRPLTWDKPTLAQRNALYPTMQWRTYFINLNRGAASSLQPAFARYLCQEWNAHHSGGQTVEQVEVNFVEETTVPPDQSQTTQKKHLFDQSCELPHQT